MSDVEKSTVLDQPLSVERLKATIIQHSLGSGTQNYSCGHCGIHVAGLVVTQLPYPPTLWLLCTSCGRGSVKAENTIHPSPLSGPQVEDLPPEVGQAYDEARKIFAVNAYTGCELLCRKILMNVAVDKEADEGKTFEYYINYLKDGEHITASMIGMADMVRNHGNKAAHKIEQPSEARAKVTLEFTVHVLRSVYEAEHQLKRYTDSTATI